MLSAARVRAAYRSTDGGRAPFDTFPFDRLRGTLRASGVLDSKEPETLSDVVKDGHAETALRLGRYFGNDALFWINLQAQYDLAVAERDVGRRIAREVEEAA